MNAVDNNLSATAGDLYNSKLHTQLWAAINDEIHLKECDIYRYAVIYLFYGIELDRTSVVSIRA